MRTRTVSMAVAVAFVVKSMLKDSRYVLTIHRAAPVNVCKATKGRPESDPCGKETGASGFFSSCAPCGLVSNIWFDPKNSIIIKPSFVSPQGAWHTTCD